MNIRSLILATTLTLPLSLPAFACPAGGHHKAMGDKLVEALELDEARAAQVRQIMDAHHQERKALHQETREKMKALHQDHREQLAQVLTEDEMAQLKQMKKEKFKKDGKHMHDGGQGMHDSMNDH